VFGSRTRGFGSRVDIRTIDSLICEIAGAYHRVLNLPADTGAWARNNKAGYHELSKKAAALLASSPFIAQSLAQRYHTIICDEHQDASSEQHLLATACSNQGSLLRVFGDPMQRIYGWKAAAGTEADYRRWDSLKQTADMVGKLDQPRRWLPQAKALGDWILEARSSLMNGKPIDLRRQLPPGVSVIFAENKSPKPRGYYIASNESGPIYQLISKRTSVLLLTAENDTVDNLRGMFRLPIWEGHVRNALNTLIAAVQKHKGEPDFIGESLVTFIESVATGFSRSAYSDRFLKEIQNKCLAKLRGKPRKLQALGQRLLVQADHKGVAGVLQSLGEFMRSDQDFKAVRLDYCREFWDAIKLGHFEDPQEAFAELARRRSYARLKPPSKAISTISQSKGT
jgi:DNA helicase-2/ATP-dependent DNA helicase PcrA